MLPRHFVVAKLPELATLAGGYTAGHPGSSSDAVLEHAIDDGPNVEYQSLGLLQGWPRADAESFATRLRSRDVEMLTLQHAQGGSLLRYNAKVGRLVGSAAWLLNDAADAIAAPWMHVQDGQHSIRAPGRSREHASACADQLGEDWARQGSRCDVAVRRVEGADLRAWTEVPESLHDYGAHRPAWLTRGA